MAKVLLSYLSPGSLKKGNSGNVENEILRLYNNIGDASLFPTIADYGIKYNNKDYDFTAKEYTEYQKNYGQTAYSALSKVMASDTYKTADDKAKAEMIDLCYEYATEYSKNKYLATKGVKYDVSSWVKTVFNADNKISLEDAIVWKATKNIYNNAKEVDSSGESSDANKELLKLKEISDKGFDIPQYYDEKSKIENINAKDENGNSVSGLKKKRVKQHLREANIDDKLKDYLWNELGYKGS